MENEELRHKMIVARGKMVHKNKFFAQLALNLQLHFTDRVETAYTDGILLAVNPEWAKDLKEDGLRLLWSDAAMKCSMGLPFRRGHRGKDLWNEASTLSSTQYLEHEFTLPDQMPRRTDLDDKNTEEKYQILLKEGGGNGKGGGGGGYCLVESPEGKTAKDGHEEFEAEHGEDPCQDGDGMRRVPTNKQLEGDWNIRQRAALNNMKMSGNVPSWMEELINANSRPQIDWRSKLREYVGLTVRDNYTFKRINTRYMHTGFALPMLWDETLPDVVVLADVSGSVSNIEMEYFMNELTGILSDFPSVSAHLYQFDTEPKGECETYKYEDLPLRVTRRGCGGTDPESTLYKVQEDDHSPACVIIFTDMELYRWPNKDSWPDVPTLWVSSQKLSRLNEELANPPFGEVCELTID